MRADLSKEPREVSAMFDAVAPRYDRANDLLSGFRDRSWRRATVAALGVIPGDRILDVAGGTGTSAAALADAGADVVCADFSLGMLGVATTRPAPITLVAADATHLPFADQSFDAVTISFGLRNVSDVPSALAEMLRVTRPGGRLVICEFAHPVNRVVRAAYRPYLEHVLPRAARAISPVPEAYSYLSDSIRAWPDRAALATLLAQAGWRRIGSRDLTGGVVALHRAWRPPNALANPLGRDSRRGDALDHL